MSNEITAEKPDAIKILEAKINAFNRQWQEYNQNWTNISKIPLDKLIKLTFSGEIITYNDKIIVKWKDSKLCYYLFNLPNYCGIRIREEDSAYYITETETQDFSSNKFVYHIDDNFIGVENQKVSNDYLTIDWSEGGWVAIYIYSKYGVTLTFSGETIKYNNNIIVERKRDEEDKKDKLYYNLYNLPNHFGIRINEQDAICYSEEGKGKDKRFSVGDLIYRDGNNFIITKDPTTSGYYFTIDPVNRCWVATYKLAFFKEVGSTFDFNFMQRLDSPYTYFWPISNSYRDHVIGDVNRNISNYHRENYGMEAPFHLYTMKKLDNKNENNEVISSTYEEIYDDQTWYFRSEVIDGVLKNNLVILYEKPVSAESFYQLVR